MELTDRTIVITGGANGIGAATARMSAGRGAKVVVSDIDDDAGQATVQHIVDNGGLAEYIACDVADEDDVDQLMTQAARTYGGIDVLHNNAGIHEAMISDDVSFESMSVETFDRVLAVNLRSAFLCTKAALPHLKKSAQDPSVINAGSTASWVGYPFGLAYGTSKGGIALLTKNLAVALAPHGIRVNCYCPASVDTNMVAKVSSALGADQNDSGADVDDPHLGAHLVRRIGHPDDIAELVCFLAGPRSTFVNGVTWLIDGGTLAWRDSVEVLGMN